MIDLSTLTADERMACRTALAQTGRSFPIEDWARELNLAELAPEDMQLCRMVVREQRETLAQERKIRAALGIPFDHQLPAGVVPMRRTRESSQAATFESREK